MTLLISQHQIYAIKALVTHLRQKWNAQRHIQTLHTTAKFVGSTRGRWCTRLRCVQTQEVQLFCILRKFLADFLVIADTDKPCVIAESHPLVTSGGKHSAISFLKLSFPFLQLRLGQFARIKLAAQCSKNFQYLQQPIAQLCLVTSAY